MRVLWAIFAMFFAGAASATAVRAESRVALVIGNASYVNTAPLAQPANDVDDIAAALRRLNFQVIEGKDLDKRSMERTVRQFAVGLTGADVALLYYAGHGLQVGGQNYLVPIDARLSSEGDVDFESVPLALIVRQMEREAKTSIILLDACRDNPLGRNLARSMGTRAVQIGQGLAEMKTGVGTLIGFSTRPGSISLDGTGRNSHYAAALLDHIEVPGKDVSSMLVSVRNDVLKATTGTQVPWEHTSLTGRVFLRPEPRLAAGQGKDYEKEREITYWNSVRDAKSAPALQAYLERYPRGTFASLARTMLADLTQKPAAPIQTNVTVASKEPVVVLKPQVVPGDDPRTLARDLRKELARVGCLAGGTDGAWDGRSRQALTEFSQHAKTSLPVFAPTLEALQAVQARKDRVCPLKCGKGETEDDGECVAKARPKRQPLRASAEDGYGPKNYGTKQKLCWTQGQRGTQSVGPCSE
jgi:hypothetical protein